MYRKLSVVVLVAAAFAAIPGAQQEKLDFAAIGQIRDEGLNRSQAMETLRSARAVRMLEGPSIVRMNGELAKHSPVLHV